MIVLWEQDSVQFREHVLIWGTHLISGTVIKGLTRVDPISNKPETLTARSQKLLSANFSGLTPYFYRSFTAKDSQFEH